MPSFPITLTVTTGRSGSSFLYHSFMEAASRHMCVHHELLHPMVAKPAMYHRSYGKLCRRILDEPIVGKLIQFWRARAEVAPVVDFGWTMSSLVPAMNKVFGDQLRVIFLHRNPIEYAASAAVVGRYSEYDHPYYSLTPKHSGAYFRSYESRWQIMSSFEKAMYHWLEIAYYGLEISTRIPTIRYKVVGFEQLTRNEKTLGEIADFIGLRDVSSVPIHASTRKNPLMARNLEIRPIGDEWRLFEEHEEVIKMASRLSYNLDRNSMEMVVKKYARPVGVLPWLRAVLGYWKIRHVIAKNLRRFGLRRKEADTWKLQRQIEGDLGVG